MPSIPVELKAPDIEPHRRSPTGTDFIHTLESGKPGPHVLVNALTHGNEICGAIVVDRLLRRELRPVRGTLTLAFANVEAFFRFDPASPYASRFVDEDFNRVWTPDVLDGPRETAELRRARMLRPFVDAEYGSATFIGATTPSGGTYEVRVSPTGLLVRPSRTR